MPQPKRHACWFCGEDLGVYADHDHLDTCGKAECEREAREAAQAERLEAHDLLDDRMGWK